MEVLCALQALCVQSCCLLDKTHIVSVGPNVEAFTSILRISMHIPPIFIKDYLYDPLWESLSHVSWPRNEIRTWLRIMLFIASLTETACCECHKRMHKMLVGWYILSKRRTSLCLDSWWFNHDMAPLIICKLRYFVLQCCEVGPSNLEHLSYNTRKSRF